MTKYLGADVKTHKNSDIELRQPFLIDRLVECMELEQANEHDVPAVSLLLHKDLEGVKRVGTWNFRFVVRMLNYIANLTRPDVLFATHQCARFCNDPNKAHKTAIKRVEKYFKRTNDKGIILSISRELGLDCYVGADFAGGWNRSDSDDLVSVMLQTWYVIRHMGCPILWVSKIQTEIAISTTEAEYITLSQAMRDVIPMTNLIEELNAVLKIEGQKPIVRCKVFEDNNGAMELANAPKMRPRTKHIALKYHHFSKAVRDQKVNIVAVDAKQQIANIFTKPLYKPLFEHLHMLLNKW